MVAKDAASLREPALPEKSAEEIEREKRRAAEQAAAAANRRFMISRRRDRRRLRMRNATKNVNIRKHSKPMLSEWLRLPLRRQNGKSWSPKAEHATPPIRDSSQSILVRRLAFQEKKRLLCLDGH
jgi:hypothetical protein